MLIQPHILSVITTHRCTAACDHCCFSCHPDREEHIPVKNIHKYIEQAAEIDSLKVVAFTGGECFLLGKDLDDLVKTADRNHLHSRFVSNGYWATSPRVATQRLQRLVDSGLDEANFSTGDMHSKYVRKEYIINGAVAAAEMGLPTLIMVETFAGSTFDFDGFVSDARLKPMLESGRISVKLSPWVKFEGKSDLNYTKAYQKELGKSRTIGCTTIMRVIAINPDEHLIACCGLTFEEIEELHLGDLRKKSIGEILRETPDDFIKIWIHMQGPDAVIDYARSVDPTIQVPAGMAHICDICRFMYHHPRILKALLKNPPPFRDDIIREYAMSLFRPVSQEDMEASIAFFQKGCSVEEVKGLRKMSLA